MPRKTRTRIHVYYTLKGGMRAVVLTGSDARRGRRVRIDGPSTLLTDQKPLRSGATTWIETYAPVKVFR